MNKGFIYASMLIGLMLLSSLGVLFYPQLSINNDKLIFKQEVDLIKTQIDLMRLCGIEHQKANLVLSEHQVTTNCQQKEKSFIVKSSLKNNFPNNKVSFNQQGHINRSGTIEINYRGQKGDIVLHIGGGFE